jgi:hypothetical protein
MKNSIFKTGENLVRFPVTRLRRAVLIIAACFIASSAVVQAQVDSVAIIATRDNSIYAALRVNSTSFGRGSDLIAGQVRLDGYYRRALVFFNIPRCYSDPSLVDSVAIRLYTSADGHHINAAGTPINMYALTETWGEGCSGDTTTHSPTGATAQPGDATWNSRYLKSTYPNDTTQTILWTIPGAIDTDFVDPVAVSTVPNPYVVDTAMVWKSEDLTKLVKEWIATPCSNSGVLLQGAEGTSLSAASFHSKDGCIPDEQKPTLIIYFKKSKSSY